MRVRLSEARSAVCGKVVSYTNLMSSTAVEQIKERLSILDVVGQYVQLQKAGRQFKGKSPFTNEKTPSFFVSPDRGMYYCFSSGKGGDIFTFVQEMEGVDFRGALTILAERAGVELVHESKESRTERDTLHAVLEEATQYFEAELAKRPEVMAYLQERGVSEYSVRAWRIGYAPDEWRSLAEHLAKRGFSETLMLRSGLAKRAEGKDSVYDVFRGRVMFPLSDASGRVVAFSGRTLSSEPGLPKYVNSPETELYQKSHILFGYDKAKQGIRKSTFALIVEGQFDLVLAHQAGYRNTVAISGTALSEHHVGLLSRLAQRVVLALDADRAGISSVKRSSEILLSRGMDVKVAAMPEGRDPADLVVENPALLKAAVRDAKTVIEFLVEVLRTHARDERAFRLSVREEVLPFVARIPSPLDREHFVQAVAGQIGMSAEAIRLEVARIIERAVPRQQAPVAEPKPIAEVAARTKALRTEELARFAYAAARLAEGAMHEGMAEGATEAKRALEELRETVGSDAWERLGTLPEEEANRLFFEVERDTEALAPAARATLLSEVLGELRVRTLRRELAAARERLHAAEGAGDEGAVAMELKACTALQKRLAAASGS